jgi:hypothetical protein
MSADGNALLAEVKGMLPFLQSEAARHDQLAEFPPESFERLRQAHPTSRQPARDVRRFWSRLRGRWCIRSVSCCNYLAKPTSHWLDFSKHT